MNYENKWFAISEDDRVVGSDNTPNEAKAEADANGYEDAALFKELSEPELEAVMMHEVANLHRLVYVFWFYPMVWILDHVLLAERERLRRRSIRLGGV